jgi:iron complex outermembrane receptor protein
MAYLKVIFQANIMFKQVCALLALIIVFPISAAQSLSGVVFSKNKHAEQVPIANAKVQIHGHNHSEQTDAQGRFVIELESKTPIKNAVDPNTYELHVSAKGFQHKNILVDNTTSTTLPLQVELAFSVMDHIDVYASPLHSSTIESASAISVISDEELHNKHTSTLGETLKYELGVHSTYFGPVSSSPIIRGLDGPRVMITQNGLDASDASRVGPDHVVSTETSTVKQVEILRGPATLLFGNGAIGGVINVVDNRVPTNDEFEADYQISHNTVSNENELSVNLSTGLAAQGFDNVAVHFDAFTRSSDDYEIPGPAESEDAHDEEEEEDHEEHEEEFTGVLENSAADSDGFNLGASYLFDSGFVGVSFGQLNRLYGITGHSHEEEEEEHDEEEHEEEEHEEEIVQGDMTQDRVQVLSAFEFDHSFITGLQTKFGYTDYHHAELENGEIGTQFYNKTTQLKSDLIFAEIAGWHGALSVEYKHSDFSAEGEEAFTPPSVTENTSIALLEERHLGSVLLQLGARVESIDLSADIDGVNQSFDFSPISLSSGIVWDFTDGYNLGVSLTRSERAPSASELLSLGAHIGTSSYEVGSLYEIEFDEADQHSELVLSSQPTELETANNAELTLRKFNGDFGFVINLFYNTVDNFYYQNETGLLSSDILEHDEEEHHDEEEDHEEEGHEHEESDLPVYITQTNNAKFYGIESQFKWQVTPELKLALQADTIVGELTNGEYLPRIPPNRIGLSFKYQGNSWDLGAQNMFYFSQTKLAPLETKTDSYNMTDIDFAYYFQAGNQDLTAFANIRNVFDVEARVHSSYLKDLTLLPARGLHVGVRGKF